MSKRIYPHRSVKYWKTYDIDEICTLFSEKGLHPQTVRKWISKDGLKTIGLGKPALIYGNDLIAFLKERNTKRKCKTDFDQFFCMKCQDASYLFQNKIALEQNKQVLKGQAVCRSCKGRMYRNYSLDDIGELKATFKVVGVLELYDCTGDSDKTHIVIPSSISQNESGQYELLV